MRRTNVIRTLSMGLLLLGCWAAAAACKSSAPRTAGLSEETASSDQTENRLQQKTPASEQNAQNVNTTEVFKLYRTPNPIINPACDVFMAAALFKGSGDTWTLRVENRVDGPCELHVDPSRRTFTVSRKEDECRSVVLQGGELTSATGWAVTLHDHRERVCADLPPALLILDYKSPTGTVRWYGGS